MTETSTDVVGDTTDKQIESALRVVVERFPNPECTSFHVNQRFHGQSAMRFRLRDGEVKFEDWSNTGREIDEKFTDFATQVYAAPGVTDGLTRGVEVTNYELKITKAVAFTDTQVEKSVIQLIADFFGIEPSQVEVTVQDKRGYHPEPEYSSFDDLYDSLDDIDLR